MMLSVPANEHVTSMSETIDLYSRLKETPVVGPLTLVEPANGFPSTAADRSNGCRHDIYWYMSTFPSLSIS